MEMGFEDEAARLNKLMKLAQVALMRIMNYVNVVRVFIQTAFFPIEERLTPQVSIIKFLLVTLHIARFYLSLGHKALA
jgi:hypothetical protein